VEETVLCILLEMDEAERLEYILDRIRDLERRLDKIQYGPTADDE